MLDSIPVYAVLVEDLGERGAKFVAVKLLHQLEKENGHTDSPHSAVVYSGKIWKNLLWVSLASTGLLYASAWLKK